VTDVERIEHLLQLLRTIRDVLNEDMHFDCICSNCKRHRAVNVEISSELNDEKPKSAA
jgi:hypothetical protein